MFNRKPKHVYGVILNKDDTVRNKARINRKTGDVEFMLWKAGEQGHTEDFWHRMGSGWETMFQPDELIK